LGAAADIVPGTKDQFGPPISASEVSLFRGGHDEPGSDRRDDRGYCRGHGRLDILVNNAGIQHVAPLEQVSGSEMGRDPVNQSFVAFHTMRVSLPAMRQNKFGRIINIASAHGLVASALQGRLRRGQHGLSPDQGHPR
jgi:3-hydroxybutyrate dehydrogenase